nr:hypothetical protein Q903MT_gene5092 [Picea sitchensis]
MAMLVTTFTRLYWTMCVLNYLSLSDIPKVFRHLHLQLTTFVSLILKKGRTETRGQKY